jgi:CheY-like chemotaxis protein
MQELNALDALIPGPRRLVLCALFHEPGRWWSLPELGGRVGLQPASLRQHLSVFRDAGIAREKSEGGRAWFQANSESPVFAEIQSLIAKLSPRAGSAETILVVEDQPATAQITRILLESWGYRVLEAHSGAEALATFEGNSDGIHLVLTDMIMPGITGTQLAAELQRRSPNLRIVFMSGYPNEHLENPEAAFLPKPFNPGSLSRMIRRELDRPATSRPIHQVKSS